MPPLSRHEEKAHRRGSTDPDEPRRQFSVDWHLTPLLVHVISSVSAMTTTVVWRNLFCATCDAPLLVHCSARWFFLYSADTAASASVGAAVGISC